MPDHADRPGGAPGQRRRTRRLPGIGRRRRGDRHVACRRRCRRRRKGCTHPQCGTYYVRPQRVRGGYHPRYRGRGGTQRGYRVPHHRVEGSAAGGDHAGLRREDGHRLGGGHAIVVDDGATTRRHQLDLHQRGRPVPRRVEDPAGLDATVPAGQPEPRLRVRQSHGTTGGAAGRGRGDRRPAYRRGAAGRAVPLRDGRAVGSGQHHRRYRHLRGAPSPAIRCCAASPDEAEIQPGFIACRYRRDE